MDVVTKTNLPFKIFKKGKVRDVYEVNDNLLLVVTDRISAFDYVLPDPIPYKGVCLTQISRFWFDFFKNIVPSHLIFADVDNLKQVNDSFGHDAGDKILIHASKILRSFRSSDIVARMGGDEFAILVIGDEAQNSKPQIEKRFTDLIDESKNEFGDDYQLSMSHGVVQYDPSTPSSLEQLLSQADSLMYECKKERQGQL